MMVVERYSFVGGLQELELGHCSFVDELELGVVVGERCYSYS
jgi:hypothetical protein